MSTGLLEPQSSPTEPQKVYTPEDLLRIPDGHRFELIDGKLVERNMDELASQIALKTCRLVGNHVEAGKLGKVFTTDCGYQIFGENANRVRFPYGSFVARGRLPGDQTPASSCYGSSIPRIAPYMSIAREPPWRS